MNTVTYDDTASGRLLNALLPYFLVYNLAHDKISDEQSVEDKITVTITKKSDCYDIVISLTVIDVVGNTVMLFNETIYNCKNDSISSYLTDTANIVVDTTVLTDKTPSILTCTFNPCCCMFVQSDTADSVIEIKKSEQVDCTLLDGELYFTSNYSALNIHDRTLDGVRSVNGLLPVNGNIDINGKYPIYLDTYSKA